MKSRTSIAALLIACVALVNSFATRSTADNDSSRHLTVDSLTVRGSKGTIKLTTEYGPQAFLTSKNGNSVTINAWENNAGVWVTGQKNCIALYNEADGSQTYLGIYEGTRKKIDGCEAAIGVRKWRFHPTS